MDFLFFIGKLILGSTVDITDPCYNKDVWCRITTECTPGTYYAYVERKDEGKWGVRNAYLYIFKNDKRVKWKSMKAIGTIGVDSGSAGFFDDKPDYTDEEYTEVVSKKFFPDGEISRDFAQNDDGVFCSSGYGDGMYEVRCNKCRTAFAIRFI